MRVFAEIVGVLVALAAAAGAVNIWVVQPIRWIDRKLDELKKNASDVIELRTDVDELTTWELDHIAIHRRLVDALKGAGVDYDERATR